jgi:hypothetical protein
MIFLTQQQQQLPVYRKQVDFAEGVVSPRISGYCRQKYTNPSF